MYNKKDTPIVYCNYIKELIAIVLRRRNQETNYIKLGVVGGQGFGKVSPSITLKPVKNDKLPEKLSSVTDMREKNFGHFIEQKIP